MSEYTLEELLKAIGEEVPENEEPLVVYDSKIGEFLDKLSIKPGKDRIPTYVIFWNYVSKFGGKIGKTAFFREFNKHFKNQRRRTGKQRAYMLDGGSFDMSREGLLEAEFYEEKEKQKRSREISRPKRKNKSKTKA